MATLPRSNPNILITGMFYKFVNQIGNSTSIYLQEVSFLGTPGVGKSTICKHLAEKSKYTWREVSKMAEEYNCLDEFDPEYQCPILNEDKVLLL